MVQVGQEVHDRTTSWDESLGNSAHEQVTFREGRWKVELRLRHVRNEISQGARSQTGEEEDEHHQQLAGVAQGVGEVPDKWKTPTLHDAGVENHRMPHVQERVLQNRVRETEKNNSDNTSSVPGRLSLGPSEEKDITGTINELTKVDPHEQELSYDPFEFLDDVTGQTLDKKMAVEARKLEMQFFRNMKVHDKVPRWMAARDGCKVITTKWRDINKRRPAEPELQSQAGRQGDQDRFSIRLVCRHPSIGVPAPRVQAIRTDKICTG